jgi:hypothetical protein
VSIVFALVVLRSGVRCDAHRFLYMEWARCAHVASLSSGPCVGLHIRCCLIARSRSHMHTPTRRVHVVCVVTHSGDPRCFSE